MVDVNGELPVETLGVVAIGLNKMTIGNNEISRCLVV